MARADIVLNLVKTGVKGDMGLFKKTVQALVAEERAKNHYVLAEQLTSILNEYNTSIESSVCELKPLHDSIYERIPGITFDDLVLSNEVSKQTKDFIEEHHRKDLLRSYNLEPKHKVLLFGPPGNGKTSVAEAIAHSLMLPFVTLHYEDVIHSYLGETAKKLDQVFEHVKTRHCVLFMDEFEAISKERGDQLESGEIKRLVSSLLTQIERLPPNVIVIAATNHTDMIDKAFWRRFQMHVEMKKPTQSMVKKWFELYTRKTSCDLGYPSQVMSEKMKGYSYSELEAFTLDVLRRHVLGKPNSDIKKIIDAKVIEWKKRLKA